MIGVELVLYKIGIIGNGNQSKRIQKILKNFKKKFYIYKPENKKNYFNNNEFKILQTCKIIFITSPNKTHFNYLKLLSKGRYIFCEKPPTSNLNELNQLYKYNYGNIYFNFNFRFSTFCETLEKSKKYKLGKLISGNIHACHGLAFKKEYSKNWRSNKKLNPLGVLEMVLIHYIDMINYIFKLSKPSNLKLNNFSNKGTSPDTCNLDLKYKDAIINFFSTYSSPLYNRIFLLFQNGYIEQSNERIEIRGPRMHFGKSGEFIRPKLIKAKKINYMEDFNLSLVKSVRFFLSTSSKKGKFSNKHFKKAISSNKLILNLN